jgi:hypothetical protein
LREKPSPHVHEYCNTNGFRREADVRPSWHSRALRETMRATLASSSAVMCEDNTVSSMCVMCVLVQPCRVHRAPLVTRVPPPMFISPLFHTVERPMYTRWSATTRAEHAMLLSTPPNIQYTFLRMCKTCDALLSCVCQAHIPQHNSGNGPSSTFQNTTRRTAPNTPLKNQ